MLKGQTEGFQGVGRLVVEGELESQQKPNWVRRTGRGHLACLSGTVILPGGELRRLAEEREAAVAVQELDPGRKRHGWIPSLPPGSWTA